MAHAATAQLCPGLPVIPIWVAFLPLVRGWVGLPLLGQDETYARYIAPAMSKHGAVVVFFGSQWNVLVGCPQGMTQLFDRERSVFHKRGNHRKLPRAVISALTGGNIISETGEVGGLGLAALTPRNGVPLPM
jgi:unspecific monooxygenase